MKKQHLILFILIFPLIQSCQNSKAFSNHNGEEPAINSSDYLTMAVLYQQTAAEYRALCYQAFNLARTKVDASSKMIGGMKSNAVVVDIDETMFDNSPYEAKCILDAIHYPAAWDDWMNSSSAKAVPGALEFAQYARDKGVQIYYISNRKEKYRKQTLNNLQTLGFPNADDEHLMLRSNVNSKKGRREKVAAHNNIILLIGDNLNDFSEIFEEKTNARRFALTDEHMKDFGNRFIVLPNAMYGEWEGAIFDYDYSIDEGVKLELRKKALTSFE